MNIDIHFTIEEKIKFLNKMGYDVQLLPYTMYSNEYHNQVEEFVEKVYHVYKYGESKPYHEPCSKCFNKTYWLDTVFEEEISKKLKNILLK